MRTRLWLVLGVVVLGLLAPLAAWRLERFMTPDPPPVAGALASSVQRPPLEDCRRGRIDFGRPPAQSFIEEAEVFSVVLTYRFFGGGGEPHPSPRGFPSLLQIRALTADPWMRDLARSSHADAQSMNVVCSEFPKLDLSTVRSFRYVNAQPVPLLRWFAAPRPIRFTSSVPDAAEWSAFSTANPGVHGVTALSRVGFADDYTQALVFIEHRCGGTCGDGYFLMLEHSDGRWRVTGRLLSWIS